MSLEPKNLIAALQCELVSAEGRIFSGLVKLVSVTGVCGELGVLYGHSPLLTSLPPGQLKLVDNYDQEQYFFVEGGYLEVQPTSITVLADTVLRASEIDLEQAQIAKANAEKVLSSSPTKINFSKASYELLEAVAKIHVMESCKTRKV